MTTIWFLLIFTANGLTSIPMQTHDACLRGATSLDSYTPRVLSAFCISNSGDLAP